jgi:hypothetical protein
MLVYNIETLFFDMKIEFIFRIIQPTISIMSVYNMETLLSIFNSVTKEQQLYLVEKLPASDIEELYNTYPKNNFEVSWKDVFYDHTFSLDFLEQHLCHEDVKFWKHVSTWYQLPLDFCQRNILHLHIGALQKYQLEISDAWLKEQAQLYYGPKVPEPEPEPEIESESESESDSKSNSDSE